MKNKTKRKDNEMNEPRLTVDEAARQRGYKVYDLALPQPWVDSAIKEGYDPRAHCVWLYDKCKIFGEPASITKEGDEMLELMKLELKIMRQRG